MKHALRRACYDSHSNETVWRWYGAVAPASWLAHYDVTAGRNALNFSDWGTLRLEEHMQEVGESVAEGEMPPRYYTALHRQARLSALEKAAIAAWAGPFGQSER